MKTKMVQFLVSIFTMLMLIVSASTLVNVVAPIIGDDGLNKAYAFGSKRGNKHRGSQHSSQTVNVVPDETGVGVPDQNLVIGPDGALTPAPNGKPIASVPEPSTLILLGSALGAAVFYKRMKSRKRSKSS